MSWQVFLGNSLLARCGDGPGFGSSCSLLTDRVLGLLERHVLAQWPQAKAPAISETIHPQFAWTCAGSFMRADNWDFVELTILAVIYGFRDLQNGLALCRPDQVKEIRGRLRELHRQTRSSSFFSRCSLRSAPAATRGSACMSLADLTAAESKRASIAAMFPDGNLALASDAVRKELDAQLQEALRAVTPGVQATARASGQKKVQGTSLMVDFLRATCPGLVPASANRAKKRISAARRPATVPKPCTLHPAKEDSGFYIPTRPVIGA